MRIRRGFVVAAMTCALLMMLGGADATAEPGREDVTTKPDSDRACVDPSSFNVTASPDASATLVSFRVVRCSS